MSEPTKEAIEEAERLADTFGMDCGSYFQFTENDVARLIAHVRQKAASDALERAALHFLRDGPYVERFSDSIADDLRALKDQPTGGA